MSHESWKVFLACAIGAGIGSLVALEMHPMLWWVGLIVGFVTGYLSYEWRAVLRAVPQAWRVARGCTITPDMLAALGWFPLAFTLGTGWVIGFSVMAIHFLGLQHSGFNEQLRVALAITGMTGSVAAAGVFITLLITPQCGYEEGGENPYVNARKASQRVCYYLFPPLVLCWHLPRGIIWCARRTPALAVRTVRFFRRFSWQLFLRIHSEMRLLCGVDAMLGTIVGYCNGSALVGACIGGALGVLNYTVVTKRFLEPRGYLPIRP